jgi:histone deacetylase complex regulatory component SIN3
VEEQDNQIEQKLE